MYASAVLKSGSNELNLNYLHAICPLILELSNRMVTTNFSFLPEHTFVFHTIVFELDSSWNFCNSNLFFSLGKNIESIQS